MKQRKLVATKRITKYRSKKTGRFITKKWARARKVKGEYYQETRMKGVIIKAPRWKPPKVAYMWRTTVAINYQWHRVYYSYKVTVYAKHRKDLPSQTELEEITKDKFEIERGYTVQELADAGQQIRIGYEKPTKIKRDEKLMGETIAKDEKLRDKREWRTAPSLLKMIWKRIIGGK